MKLPTLIPPRVFDSGIQRALDAFRAPVQGLLDYVRQRPDSVKTILDLSSLPSLPLDVGYRIWVEEVEDIYTLYRVSRYVPDYVAVVPASEGGQSVWVARQRGRWNDLYPTTLQGRGSASLTQEDFPAGAAWDGLYLRHNQDDELSLAFQMSHEWDGGVVYPHLHIVACADPAGGTRVMRFNWRYAWAKFGDVFPAWDSWTQGTTDYLVTTTNWGKHQVVAFGAATPPANPLDSTMLLFWVQRQGNSGSDTYSQNKVWSTGSANCLIMSIDAHFRKAKEGSTVQFYIPG